MRARELFGSKVVRAIALTLVVLVPWQLGAFATRAKAPSAPTSAPGVHDPDVVRSSPVVPSPAPRSEPGGAQRARRPDPREGRLWAFGGFGAWVDVYDFESLVPSEAVAELAVRGVRTLFIQTGRYNTPHAVAPEVGPWLEAAHRADLKVVGWYLPNYRPVRRDVARTVAIARYEWAGHRFDGLGIDIEFKDDVAYPPTWNARVVEHARTVRERLGRRYPIAAITPPPLQMDVAPLRWAGFPWEGLAEVSDVFMLMSYWSYRDCGGNPDHCAYPFTHLNVSETRRLVGDKPVHTIGGVGDVVGTREVADFVRGALHAEAFGASLYDLRTTAPAYWRHLAKLRRL